MAKKPAKKKAKKTLKRKAKISKKPKAARNPAVRAKAQSSKKSTKKRELKIERIFNAPRERIWDAWTVPDFFRRWWGPKGFTSPVCKIDLKVGGNYLACMRSADGKDIWSTGIYRDIDPLKKISMTDCFADEKGNIVPATYYGMSKKFPMEAFITVSFEDIKGKTKIILEHPGIPAEYQESTRTGWLESFEKLDAILARVRFTAEPGKPGVTVIAVFDAPRERVFKALTGPAFIPLWWGPRFLTTKVDKMDVKPGGSWRFVQSGQAGNEYVFNGKYIEVTPPERISYTFEFEGMPGHVLKETLTLFEEDGKTTATERVEYSSIDDRDAMIATGMESGSVESMDRLAELLMKL